MIKKVKSLFILKFIFKYIDYKRKLNIAAYDKKIINILNINITDYKFISGKYKTTEKLGKGKEYDDSNNKLIFEGEYKNGKRNGKGKEYFSKENLKFEGEYRSGKRNGKGKEYYFDNQLKFEGIYFNGKEWNGKGYDLKNNIIYEIKDGKGFIKKFDYFGKLIFIGKYFNAVKYGKGKEYDKYNNLIFEGEYLNGLKWNGKGYIKKNENNNDISYEIINGKGYVKEYNKGILRFEGYYLYGNKNGKGKEYSTSGKLEFEGEYINGKRNGKGRELNSEEKIEFEGEYLYGRKLKGKEYAFGKLFFKGDYLNNKRWKGEIYDTDGSVKFQILNGITLSFFKNNKNNSGSSFLYSKKRKI